MSESGALFDLPASRARLPETAAGWPDKPVASILLETPVPHLDRFFEYLIPHELDKPAQPGVRVKVRFGHQIMVGWLIARSDEVTTRAKLSPVRSVVSALPVLRDDILQLAEEIAVAYVGTTSDVLRNAVPPRVAAVEKSVAASLAEGTTGANYPNVPHEKLLPLKAPSESEFGWDAFSTELTGGVEQLWDFTNHNGAIRAIATLSSTHGSWDGLKILLDAAARTLNAGRDAILIFPEQRTLDRAYRLARELVDEHEIAVLSAEQGANARYRNFLEVLTGDKHLVLGTRSGIWAPVAHLGFIGLWDESDELLIEPRAPYYHVTAVARARSEATESTVLCVSSSRSINAQYQIETGQYSELEIPRFTRRAVGPRVMSSTDSYQSSRDPMASRARIPSLAWRVAKDALEGKNTAPGPVLFQVGRAGFIPGLVCDRCHTPARCQKCAGPLVFPNSWAAERGEPSCRWCGTVERNFHCSTCRGTRLRAGSRGVGRTAEELGRAFPMVPVISSSAEHMVSTLKNQPAVVVATYGSEPVVDDGYAAAVLLDGDSMLQREGLSVPEEVLGHWFRATGLVRPASEGGKVVVTADNQELTGALIRQDSVTWAHRQLEERQQTSLPPVMRSVEVRGDQRAVNHFIRTAELPYHAPGSPWIGPTRTEEDDYQALLFFPDAVAKTVISSLRSNQRVSSAGKHTGAVRVRIDPIKAL